MRKLPAIESDYLLELEELPGYDEGRVLWEEAFGRSMPLRIEVGVGNSPFLIEVASREPGYNYLGLEYSHKRVSKFLLKVRKAGLDNIRMLQLNSARLVGDYIPPRQRRSPLCQLPRSVAEASPRKKALHRHRAPASCHEAASPRWRLLAAHRCEGLRARSPRGPRGERNSRKPVHPRRLGFRAALPLRDPLRDPVQSAGAADILFRIPQTTGTIVSPGARAEA